MLWAQDMQRAVVFYRDVLGLSERFTSPGWSELAWGDAIIALHGGGDGSEKQTGLSLQVEGLDAACDHVQANGGAITQQPEQRPGEPIKLAIIRDTEGKSVMLTQHTG